MLDFTSALYLGLRHPSESLGAWETLTLGRPAAVEEPPGASAVAAELARLQGCEAATLLPSTLHLFWDLFRVLAQENVVILRDAGAYPIAHWGTERAQALGVPVRTFLHHDVDALAQLASNAAEENLKPVVVADGYCPRCAETAPVGAYGEIARRCNGYLVVDDTQALGILGESPSPANPYGKGGGGSLRWHQTFGRHIVVGSSLAKGLGVSVAVLAGSGELIDRFRRESETRIHCSPPSVVMIRAAQRALQANQRHGETLRRRLMKLVVRLRQWLIQAGLAPAGRMPFPVQTFLSARQQPAATLHEQLLRVGVAGLLTNACQTRTASLTLLVTARHQFAEIEHAGRAVAHVARSVTADFDHYMRPGRSRHRFAGDASKDLVRAS